MWEQEEYKKEGIDWTGVTFADNKPVLVRDMVQPPYHPACVYKCLKSCFNIRKVTKEIMIRKTVGTQRKIMQMKELYFSNSDILYLSWNANWKSEKRKK